VARRGTLRQAGHGQLRQARARHGRLGSVGPASARYGALGVARQARHAEFWFDQDRRGLERQARCVTAREAGTVSVGVASSGACGVVRWGRRGAAEQRRARLSRRGRRDLVASVKAVFGRGWARSGRHGASEHGTALHGT
jgi:hypothetical protein